MSDPTKDIRAVIEDLRWLYERMDSFTHAQKDAYYRSYRYYSDTTPRRGLDEACILEIVNRCYEEARTTTRSP